jgi:hypothetical protein
MIIISRRIVRASSTTMAIPTLVSWELSAAM